MERVDRGQRFGVLVDYAHTPDALHRALEGLRPFTPGRVIVVFGCGGDRDCAKRRLMGEAAARGADIIFLTDDNPRQEDPAAIRTAARAGIEAAGGICREIGDRAGAIQAALEEARAGDTVLIAGKGHETIQLRGNESLPFDDREVAVRLLVGRSLDAAGETP
jgi:UDP-N-acetylmuramoyl-L-alanyl-D-glutamate--2,6-diaminopimelate ligase